MIRKPIQDQNVEPIRRPFMIGMFSLIGQLPISKAKSLRLSVLNHATFIRIQQKILYIFHRQIFDMN